MPRCSASLRALGLFALACHAAACDDGTAPSDALTVEITSETLYAPTTGQIPGIACTVTLTADARGSSDEAATWESGVLRLFAGLDREEPLDSLLLRASDVRVIMHSATISAGQRLVGGLVVTAPVPFSAAGEFRVLHGGEVEAVPVAFDCGPSIEDGRNTPLPALRIIGIEPHADRLQPADTAWVKYEAESPIGLWLTTLAISGVVNDTFRLVENFSESTVRIVPIPIPAAVPAGASLDVEVTTYDGVLRPATASVRFSPILDRDAPAGDAWITPDHAPCRMPQCQLMPGTELLVGFAASDNVGIEWLIFRYGLGPRDSIRVAQREWSREIRLPRTGDPSGVVLVHAWLRDAAGNLSADLLNEPVNFIPTLPGAVRTLQTAFAIRDAVLDPANDRLWLLESDELFAVSLASLTVAPPIPLHGRAVGFDLTPDGSEIVVALHDTMALQLVDVAAGAASPALIPLDLYTTDPESPPIVLNHVRVAADGDWYVAADDWDQGLLLSVEREGSFQSIAYHWLRFRKLERPVSRSDMLVESFDCRHLLSRILTSGWQDCGGDDVPSIEPGASGQWWASVDSIYGATLAPARSITHRDRWLVRQIAPREGGTEALVVTDAGLEVVNASDGRVMGALAGPTGDDILVAADRYVVVLGRATRRVTVYDWR